MARNSRAGIRQVLATCAHDIHDVEREGITNVVELADSAVIAIETRVALYLTNRNRDGLRPGMVTGIRIRW